MQLVNYIFAKLAELFYSRELNSVDIINISDLNLYSSFL